MSQKKRGVEGDKGGQNKNQAEIGEKGGEMSNSKGLCFWGQVNVDLQPMDHSHLTAISGINSLAVHRSICTDPHSRSRLIGRAIQGILVSKLEDSWDCMIQCSHFTDKETGVKWGQVTLPRSQCVGARSISRSGSGSTCTPLGDLKRQFFLDIKLIDGCDSLAHETGQTWPFSAFKLEATPSPGASSNLFSSPSALAKLPGLSSLSKKKKPKT